MKHWCQLLGAGTALLASLLFLSFPPAEADPEVQTDTVSAGIPVSQPGGEIPLRGVVEGFYGRPWTQDERLDMLVFLKANQMNAYIYAPKDDPYHREKWREPYPAADLAALSTLISAAKAEGVDFIFAISPGLDFHFTGIQSFTDRQKLRAKIESVYAIGGRHFAVFFDDISKSEKDGRGQARLIRWLQDDLRAAHPGLPPLIVVPTEYYRKDMTEDGHAKAYTRDFTAGLPADTLVLYTGEGVCAPRLTDADYARAEDLYGRPLGLWINYPANDYLRQKIPLGPIEDLPEQSAIPAVFFNPMEHEALSEIALATGATYAQHPAAYRPKTAWKEALQSLYGPLAPAMEDFAVHSMHMENDWADIGPADAESFSRAGRRLLLFAASEGSDAFEGAAREMRLQIRTTESAVKRLEAGLPADQAATLSPAFAQMKRICHASLTAVSYLEARRAAREEATAGTATDSKAAAVRADKLKSELAKQYGEIKAQEGKAALSEKAGVAFIKSVLDS